MKMQNLKKNEEIFELEFESFRYDENNNRLTSFRNYNNENLDNTADYDLEDKLLSYDKNTYSYTQRGTLLTKTNQKGITTYNYDEFANLISVNLADGRNIEYGIDIYDRRISKKIDGITVKKYVYEDDYRIFQELDKDNNITTQYIYGLKVNVPEYMIRDNKTYKIITDHLGSPILIINTENNKIIKQIQYDSYGNVLSDSNKNFEIPFGFAGGLYDKDTNLIRYGARDYDPKTGRWTSKEPLGFDGANNFYVYVNGDPVNFVDFTGLRYTDYTGLYGTNGYGPHLKLNINVDWKAILDEGFWSDVGKNSIEALKGVGDFFVDLYDFSKWTLDFSGASDLVCGDFDFSKHKRARFELSLTMNLIKFGYNHMDILFEIMYNKFKKNPARFTSRLFTGLLAGFANPKIKIHIPKKNFSKSIPLPVTSTTATGGHVFGKIDSETEKIENILNSYF